LAGANPYGYAGHVREGRRECACGAYPGAYLGFRLARQREPFARGGPYQLTSSPSTHRYFGGSSGSSLDARAGGRCGRQLASTLRWRSPFGPVRQLGGPNAISLSPRNDDSLRPVERQPILRSERPSREFSSACGTSEHLV
jgi:hypothetical protein